MNRAAIKSQPIRGLPLAVAALIVSTLSLSGLAARAHSTPDAGQILREIDKAPGISPPAQAPLNTHQSGSVIAVLPLRAGDHILAKAFHINATKFSEETLQAVIAEYRGQNLGATELQRVVDKISDFYTDNKISGRAFIPKQNVRDGVVEIIVDEGQSGPGKQQQ